MHRLFFLVLIVIANSLQAQQPKILLKPSTNRTIQMQVDTARPIIRQGDLLRTQITKTRVKSANIRLPFAKKHTTVRYLLDENNHAIIDGDIDLGPEKELLARHSNNRFSSWYRGTQNSNPLAITAVSDDKLLWPNGIIPYEFDDSVTESERDSIEIHIKSLNEATNLKVIPRNGHTDYVRVRCKPISWPPAGQSSLGRQGKAQLLSIRRDRTNNQRTVQHEFLHAAGIYHEQSRPDRDRYVTINYSNINEDYKGNFDIRETARTMSDTYDYCSIMHYTARAFSVNRSVNTITPRRRLTVADHGCTLTGQRSLSTLDIEGINKLYWQNSPGQFGDDIQERVSVRDIVAADIDSDGMDETIVATNATTGHRIYIYDDAKNEYALIEKFGADWGDGAMATSVNVGNWRGVGMRDIVVTRKGNNIDKVLVYAYENRMGITRPFPRTGKEWGSVHAADAKFIDLDRDGKDELVVSRDHKKKNKDRLIVFKRGNLGNIEQISSINSWGDNIWAGKVAVGDMDGDGVPEIGVARIGSFQNYPKWVVYKWTDSALTHYAAGGSNWGKDVTATDLSFGDIDGVAGAELLTTRLVKSGPTSRFIAYTKNDTYGDNGITPFGLGFAKGLWATCLTAADIDGDGKAEVAIGRNKSGDYNVEVRGDRAEGYERLYRFGKHLRASNSPQSSWYEGSLSVSSSAYPTAICYGDTDGNGLLEVIVGTSISLRGFDRVIVRPVGTSGRTIR